VVSGERWRSRMMSDEVEAAKDDVKVKVAEDDDDDHGEAAGCHS